MFQRKHVDKMHEHLLDLNGVSFVVDGTLGLWVKFEIRQVPLTKRNDGMRYSLSLHDRSNQRILGFDNAHKIGGSFDHWHSNEKDKGWPYIYRGPATLLKDFYCEVDKKIKLLKEKSYEKAY